MYKDAIPPAYETVTQTPASAFYQTPTEGILKVGVALVPMINSRTAQLRCYVRTAIKLL
jgi:hypothetical protein